VGVIGVILSVVTHELLHIVMHWHEIDQIGLFPDRHAIVEIIFEPSTVYNLAVEEGIAYMVTIVTLILTIMLIGDIDEMRDKRTTREILFPKKSGERYSETQNKRSSDRLAHILGIKKHVVKTPPATNKSKSKR
jgi:hypothetical protein